jgi:hypothetical protein
LIVPDSNLKLSGGIARGQRSEVRGQRSEVRGKRSDVRCSDI